MKKKKVSEKENEWKGILQEEYKGVKNKDLIFVKDELPKDWRMVSNNPNIAVPNYTKHLSGWKDMIENKMFGDTKCQDPEVANFYQVEESNITPDSFTVTSTNVNNEVVGKINLKDLWKYFAKNKTLSGKEEHCNVGVNKDWDFTKEGLNKFYHDNWVKKNINYKQKRIDFEFTPLTFWQLLPSVAFNLHCKEIELTWLCFGMYINFKRNG